MLCDVRNNINTVAAFIGSYVHLPVLCQCIAKSAFLVSAKEIYFLSAHLLLDHVLWLCHLHFICIRMYTSFGLEDIMKSDLNALLWKFSLFVFCLFFNPSLIRNGCERLLNKTSQMSQNSD